MQYRPVLASLLIVAAVPISTLLWTSLSDKDPQVLETADEYPETAPTAFEAVKPVVSAEVDETRREQRDLDWDPEVILALGGAPPPGECATETQYLIDPNTGKQIAALATECENQKPRHPYDDYPSDALAGLAYSDPFAALVLGKRLREQDPQEAWRLMLRAAALLNDGDPLDWLATVSYSRASTDGIPDVRSMERWYVLVSTSDRISGYDRQWRDMYRKQRSHVLSEEDLDRLDAIVEEQIREVLQIQKEFSVTAP